MFYDLNIPYSPDDTALPRTLAFLKELGYTTVALNHTIAGKLPADLTSPIRLPLPPHQTAPPNTPIPHLLTRCTLTLNPAIASPPNASLATLAKNYDLLAIRPTDPTTFHAACTGLDCDLVSLDLSVRHPWPFKLKPLAEAWRSGKGIEVTYSPALTARGSDGRRNLISGFQQVVRGTRGGRGVVVGSETVGAAGARGPWEVVNLAGLWGLGRERGVEAVGEGCQGVVRRARVKREAWRGAVGVVEGGERPAPVAKEEGKKGQKGQAQKGQGQKTQVPKDQDKKNQGQKRKADEVDGAQNGKTDGQNGISKRQGKKQAKQAGSKSEGP